MNRLHIFIFCFSLLASTAIMAQNWQTVYGDRTTYYNNSLDAIKIVNKTVDSTGDSTFKNYPYYFVDERGGTDYANGKIVDSTSWIARRISIKLNGYNGFANDSLQWFWINTRANVNDTFTFFKNYMLHIQGICKNVYFKDTLGVKDSIKQFKFIYTLTHGYRFDFDTAHLKTFEILLSKHKGLIKTPAFSSLILKFGGIRVYYFRYGDGIHYAPKNYFTNRAFNTLGVGDEFEYKVTNNHDRSRLYDDKYYYRVIKKELQKGTDSIKYTFLVKKHHTLSFQQYITNRAPNDPIWYWQDVFTSLCL